MSDTTEVLTNPNWEFNRRIVGFALRLNILQPEHFDDEPTLPRGLCQAEDSDFELLIEEVDEKDILWEEKDATWMDSLLAYLDGE